MWKTFRDITESSMAEANLRTPTQTAWVKEGKDVEGHDPRQAASEVFMVCGLLFADKFTGELQLLSFALSY